MKKLNVNKEKVNKVLGVIKLILFVVMLLLIYIVSPKITGVIQNMAKYLYEIESVEITRVVELILSITFIIAIFTTKSDKK